ncbi:PAS domain S-box protein [Nitratireductor mangrovi]|uniref:Blue-light-activated histidine kinase n=1 Tax=Nitratireductor mangrovi TaxID=2599600 RepID=A0A5B8L595_9HYPH|nr:PAS domain S-box protein [Nitratireductor mangrovi]QDZ03074.1 PAS domain S-box protein [Nitratireductor mangrovi]
MKRLSHDQQGLLDALPDASAIVDPEGFIIAVNRAWKAFGTDNGGDSTNFNIGDSYFATCSDAVGESGAVSASVGQGLSNVLQSHDHFSCEYPCHSPTERRWFELIIRPFVIEGSRCAILMHRNITLRKLQQIEIADARVVANELAALVASSIDPIMSFDLGGRILSWNHAAERLYGYMREEIIGQSVAMLFPPGIDQTTAGYIDEILLGRQQRFEVSRRTKTGGLRTIAESAAPVRDAHGEITAISSIHRDITEQKRLEERNRIAAQELSHRTRNLLTVIQSIVRQTARRAATVDDFHERFSARIASLLASNDLLISAQWDAVPLEELALRQMAAFADTSSDRISVGGPAVSLLPAAVQALGMSFHELSTNALKYGALSSRSGRLALTWNIRSKGDAAELDIRWEERGIDVQAKPEGHGFGHAVLTSVLESSLDASVNYEISPDRLVWRALVPGEYFRAAQAVAEGFRDQELS